MADEPFELKFTLPIFRNAVFGRDHTLRILLRRYWTSGPSSWAVWLMLNPSTADEHTDDPTMLRVIHFSQVWGYDGSIVVNLYPFIASTPKKLWRWARWERNGPDYHARDDMQANLKTIEDAGRVAAIRVVAFGSAPFAHDQPYLEQCLEAFQQSGIDDGHLYCLGKTTDGQPLHPMARGKHRITNDALPQVWR